MTETKKDGKKEHRQLIRRKESRMFEKVNGIDYGTLVDIARNYIKGVGGFEKFAEWGLINVERRNNNGNN
jgi:hypothetical protein